MKKLLLSLLAIILIIEEWLWDALTAFGHQLTHWLRLESLERRLSQAQPNAALIAFLIPVMIVMPINLAAFALLAHGLLFQGILLELLAKLLGTLLVARVFALTKPQLLTFGIIATIYSTVTRWLHWAHQKIKDTQTYKLIKTLQASIHTWFSR